MSDVSIISYIPLIDLTKGNSFVPIVLAVIAKCSYGVAPFCLMWYGLRSVVRIFQDVLYGRDIYV